jgi:hypothetical protein
MVLRQSKITAHSIEGTALNPIVYPHILFGLRAVPSIDCPIILLCLRTTLKHTMGRA